MMELLDGGRRRRRLPKRETLELVGFTALSVTAAAVLLPAIGIKAVVSALPFVKTPAASATPEDLYLIN
ncbi:hypothetical protein [Pseudarthrobacter niigatensis]|uniref:Uncharacterized protein n=1 Tax=Pseudarthrobacter niigatensis TaxID=369935 RepID=A0AAJ1SUJ6_9MICC|nr:hypothetical protein [Pseudarthrobacter niigatensis]MDQ0145984.1 hypothetical protein [Pseudarthrobacter niigatensis]MDQ0266288.1 hypothetical protein [Pseudarthrobacter niigatensis]